MKTRDYDIPSLLDDESENEYGVSNCADSNHRISDTGTSRGSPWKNVKMVERSTITTTPTTTTTFRSYENQEYIQLCEDCNDNDLDIHLSSESGLFNYDNLLSINHSSTHDIDNHNNNYESSYNMTSCEDLDSDVSSNGGQSSVYSVASSSNFSLGEDTQYLESYVQIVDRRQKRQNLETKDCSNKDDNNGQEFDDQPFLHPNFTTSSLVGSSTAASSYISANTNYLESYVNTVEKYNMKLLGENTHAIKSDDMNPELDDGNDDNDFDNNATTSGPPSMYEALSEQSTQNKKQEVNLNNLSFPKHNKWYENDTCSIQSQMIDRYYVPTTSTDDSPPILEMATIIYVSSSSSSEALGALRKNELSATTSSLKASQVDCDGAYSDTRVEINYNDTDSDFVDGKEKCVYKIVDTTFGQEVIEEDIAEDNQDTNQSVSNEHDNDDDNNKEILCEVQQDSTTCIPLTEEITQDKDEGSKHIDPIDDSGFVDEKEKCVYTIVDTTFGQEIIEEDIAEDGQDTNQSVLDENNDDDDDKEVLYEVQQDSTTCISLTEEMIQDKDEGAKYIDPTVINKERKDTSATASTTTTITTDLLEKDDNDQNHGITTTADNRLESEDDFTARSKTSQCAGDILCDDITNAINQVDTDKITQSTLENSPVENMLQTEECKEVSNEEPKENDVLDVVPNKHDDDDGKIEIIYEAQQDSTICVPQTKVTKKKTEEGTSAIDSITTNRESKDTNATSATTDLLVKGPESGDDFTTQSESSQCEQKGIAQSTLVNDPVEKMLQTEELKESNEVTFDSNCATKKSGDSNIHCDVNGEVVTHKRLNGSKDQYSIESTCSEVVEIVDRATILSNNKISDVHSDKNPRLSKSYVDCKSGCDNNQPDRIETDVEDDEDSESSSDSFSQKLGYVFFLFSH